MPQSDCGKKGHPRAGCRCDRCVARRAQDREAQNRWKAANRAYVRERDRKRNKSINYADHKRYEKTPKGYLVRSYRNMKSRVAGIQKGGSWTGKELLPKEDFYEWALNSPDFASLFAAYEASGYERRLAPSPDRIDSSGGYTLDNMRWITHSENSSLGARARTNEHLPRSKAL